MNTSSMINFTVIFTVWILSFWLAVTSFFGLWAWFKTLSIICTFALDNVQHMHEFSSTSATSEFKCWKQQYFSSLYTGFPILTLITTIKNCSLFTFFTLCMILLWLHRVLSHTYPYPSLQGSIILIFMWTYFLLPIAERL